MIVTSRDCQVKSWKGSNQLDIKLNKGSKKVWIEQSDERPELELGAKWIVINDSRGDKIFDPIQNKKTVIT